MVPELAAGDDAFGVEHVPQARGFVPVAVVAEGGGGDGAFLALAAVEDGGEADGAGFAADAGAGAVEDDGVDPGGAVVLALYLIVVVVPASLEFVY